MAGPHSDWPYPTGDPNPTEEEKVDQAGRMYAKLAFGSSVTSVAKEFGVSRDTVYDRLALISRQLPDRKSLRAITYDRSEYWIETLSRRIADEELPMLDLVRSVGELRALVDRQVSWFKLDEVQDEIVDEPDELLLEDEDWEADADDRAS